ncbi:MAG: KOW motif-containing protein [Acidobacteriota bacterium]|nr:KOW motif-containing protein [Acidobacteriota bacterium]
MTENIFGLFAGKLPSKKIRRPRKYSPGDSLRIISGAFAGFTGKLKGINKANPLFPLRVSILERAQLIKLNFTDAENE